MLRLFGKPHAEPKRLFIAGILFTAIVVSGSGILAKRQILKDPDIALLFHEKDANWIRYPEPQGLFIRWPEKRLTIFRTRFVLKKVPRQAVLGFRSMKRAGLFLDNKLIYQTDSDLTKWKQEHRVDIARYLSPGPHELRWKVMNQNGHPALIAYCKPLELFTGEGWECRYPGESWQRARLVDKTPPLSVSRHFQRADRALYSKAHIFIPLFILVFVLSFCFARRETHQCAGFSVRPIHVRGLLVGLWAILAINNFNKVPLDIGMDFVGHLEYIRYVAKSWRVPLPTEGWQMFQTPLFYLISAPVYNFFIDIYSVETVYRILRIIPLLCGAIQVELCYHALKYVYPKRKDLQVLGMIIGGLFPMNLYISQVVGNEPLAGCLSGIVVVLALRYSCLSFSIKRKPFLVIGLFLGLAILSKITAILLIPPLVFCVALTVYSSRAVLEKPCFTAVRGIALLLGVAFVVCGWYFIRNWIEMGRFFISSSINITWWQDPGYRTMGQLTSFGDVFFYPIYSGVEGIWASLYSTMWLDGFLSAVFVFADRPPWNYGFMLSGTWLSLLPTAAILIGILVSFRKTADGIRRGILFSAFSLILYVSAILYIYLSVPIYSSGKATYALGLTPCFAVLCAAGFDIITRRPFLKATVYAIVSCWAVAAYGAYFVI